jgi:hypothetical protein
MQNYLEILNLPKLPDEFINQILDGFNTLKEKKILCPNSFLTNFVDIYNPMEQNPLGLTNPKKIKKSLEENNISQSDMASDWKYSIDLPHGLEDWIKTNVMKNGIPKIFIFGNGIKFYPHIDPRKEVAINFLILKNGNAKTTFYEVKKEFQNKKIFPTVYLPYETLKKVAEYEIEQYQWYKFNPEIPHSVENMNQNEYRMILTIDAHLEKNKVKY